MGIKNYIIAAILVALPLVAGCQQRTDFDACVEYYERNVRGKTSPDIRYGAFSDLEPDMIWTMCKSHRGYGG